MFCSLSSSALFALFKLYRQRCRWKSFPKLARPIHIPIVLIISLALFLSSCYRFFIKISLLAGNVHFPDITPYLFYFSNQAWNAVSFSLAAIAFVSSCKIGPLIGMFGCSALFVPFPTEIVDVFKFLMFVTFLCCGAVSWPLFLNNFCFLLQNSLYLRLATTELLFQFF